MSGARPMEELIHRDDPESDWADKRYCPSPTVGNPRTHPNLLVKAIVDWPLVSRRRLEDEGRRSALCSDLVAVLDRSLVVQGV